LKKEKVIVVEIEVNEMLKGDFEKNRRKAKK